MRQDDFDVKYGLSWKSLQKLEYGITDPKASTLLKLCRAFEMTLPELLSFGEPRRRVSKSRRK